TPFDNQTLTNSETPLFFENKSPNSGFLLFSKNGRKELFLQPADNQYVKERCVVRVFSKN
ncbi:hypothetical protein, partial [Porphyromonas gulae]|uniref:hypothetical protein n=1 Tax=Porphyromonas gulae TaxID=111105 RepID=UPI00242DDD17